MKIRPDERTGTPTEGIIRAVFEVGSEYPIGHLGMNTSHLTLRQAQGEDLMSGLSKHKVRDKD